MIGVAAGEAASIRAFGGLTASFRPLGDNGQTHSELPPAWQDCMGEGQIRSEPSLLMIPKGGENAVWITRPKK